MTIALWLEKIGVADGEATVKQHAASCAVHHPLPHPGLVIGAAYHQISAWVRKQVRPILNPVIVDAFGIVADQFLNAEPDRLLGSLAVAQAVRGAYSPISAR